MQGIIIGNISNIYKVKTEQGMYDSYARGKLKNEEITPVVGDNVEIQITDEEKNPSKPNIRAIFITINFI